MEYHQKIVVGENKIALKLKKKKQIGKNYWSVKNISHLAKI